MNDIVYIPQEKVKKVVWNNDSIEYDTNLFNLGQGVEKFVIINPFFHNLKFKNDIFKSVLDSNSCVVFMYKDLWVAKYFNKNWILEKNYITLELNLIQEKNLAVKDNKFNEVDVNDLYDLNYCMTWYLDSKFNPTNSKIWIYKCYLEYSDNLDTKDMGSVTPIINTFSKLDVFFISYKEANAEENWSRVLEKAPHAKRVENVEGIVEAHKSAATLASTDMFYVVDGDAYLTDNFDFNFQPDVFNRNAVYVWNSQNPINDLVYGYGAVKLLPTFLTLQVRTPVDMTTSISLKFNIINEISNITRFNTDEFNTFRSAFRECAKLASGIFLQENYHTSKKRLDIWCSVGADRLYGEWAIKGANAGKKFGQDNAGDLDALKLINNIKFIETKYKEFK